MKEIKLLIFFIQQKNGSKDQVESVPYSSSRVHFSGATEENGASNHN